MPENYTERDETVELDETTNLVGPFYGPPTSIQIQSILFHNQEDDVERALEAIERACELAIFERTCSKITVSYGDCSPSRCLSEDTLTRWLTRFSDTFTLNYEFFGKNLGSARGHNRLAEANESAFLLIQNPDVVVSPRLFERLLTPFKRADVGMTEAKQLPIEHPKEYNVETGETGWATTACAMIPKTVFEELGGFDADSFFLYCDDVDFSWMVREAGLKVIFNPAAIVFHDKRLSKEGAWQPSSAERYYSAEAAVLMAHKWSRPDLAEEYLNFFRNHGDDFQRKAAAALDTRIADGRLPKPRDPEHKVGAFIGHMYTKHRFPL
jgi:GT2 family glycosyltransferase